MFDLNRNWIWCQMCKWLWLWWWFYIEYLARYFTFFPKKPRRQFFFVDEELYRTKKFFILFGLLGENHRYLAKKMWKKILYFIQYSFSHSMKFQACLNDLMMMMIDLIDILLLLLFGPIPKKQKFLYFNPNNMATTIIPIEYFWWFNAATYLITYLSIYRNWTTN